MTPEQDNTRSIWQTIINLLEKTGQSIAALLTVALLLYQTFITNRQQNSQLDRIEGELRESEIFSEKVFQSIQYFAAPDLNSDAGKARARIALIGLDIVANDDGDRKRIAQVVFFSGNPILIDVLYDIYDDNPAIFNDTEVKKALQNNFEPAVEVAARREENKVAQKNVQKEVDIPTQSTGLAANVLEQAAEKADGWIYIGRTENLQSQEITRISIKNLEENNLHESFLSATHWLH